MASSISAGTTAGTALVATADTSGVLVFQTNSGTTALTLDTSQNATFAGYANLPNTFGFKNRLINGLMQVAQRGTSGTSGAAVPTTAPKYPCVDRWFSYATGATVTVARIAGTGSNQYNLQATGAASVTAVGIGQRIEAINCYDMAGSTATLSVNISNSLLTIITWTANYANTSDTWSAKTQIATGTFTVTSTLTNYSAQISIPAAATTGIEILFTVGAQTSGTWVIGNAQLEKGSKVTSFDYRPYSYELQLCQRYYEILNNTSDAAILSSFFGGTQNSGLWVFHVTKRAQPTIALVGNGAWGNTTPTSYPGVDCCNFESATTYFYITGTTNTAVISASSEL
jgi:hypothetical protein